MQRLLFTLLLIITGLLVGYVLRRLQEGRRLSLPLPVDSQRKLLQKTALLFFLPVSFLAAVWVVPFGDLRVVLLPLLCVLALFVGGGLGFLVARAKRLPPRQVGVMICCSSFTNIGAIGALICYMFLGEPGFALVALYKMFEEITYYTVGFPLASHYSSIRGDARQSLTQAVKKVATDPFVATISSAFVLGLLLNLTNIPRPDIFITINSIFIPVGTFLLILSIGLGMRLANIRKHLGLAIPVSLIKALAVPAVVTTAAWFGGLGEIENGLPLKVVLILSAMPVAFNALVAASIYDLDLDLANSCWLVSTSSLVVLVPLLGWLLPLI